jgi:hypothetical protein
MAFRIHDNVARGEIDNRVKGIVRGKIWLVGWTEPMVLELTGNAWPDLAGCLLTFSNPKHPPAPPCFETLSPRQIGGIGDPTASRKVRVFDVPIEEAMAIYGRCELPPEHLANCLYLEWFSEANGRVVIESPDYELTISAPEWRMTPEEDTERARHAAQGMANFMQRLTSTIESHQRGQKDPNEKWDEHDYEKFLKESDPRTDKYVELLDKYGTSEAAHRKIAEEMGWDRDDGNEQKWMSEQELNEVCKAADIHLEPLEEPNPDPKREGIDWMRNENGDIRHPLQHRCLQASAKARLQVEALGLDTGAEPDLDEFLFEFYITGSKLAGALGRIARGDSDTDWAFTVACLKRALDHLHRAQAGLEAVAPKKLLPEAMVAESRTELFAIREGILRLMDFYRGRA